MYFLLINPLVLMRKHWILHKRFLQSFFNYPSPHTLFFILIGYPVCSWAKRDASWERRVSQWVTLNTIVHKSCLVEWENQTKKNNTEKEQQKEEKRRHFSLQKVNLALWTVTSPPFWGSCSEMKTHEIFSSSSNTETFPVGVTWSSHDYKHYTFLRSCKLFLKRNGG